MVGVCPLPILVAVEFENNIATFSSELARLVHIRCPLKVGITYTTTQMPGTPEMLNRSRQKAQRDLQSMLAIMAKLTPEDARTEYLILLADEAPDWRFDCTRYL